MKKLIKAIGFSLTLLANTAFAIPTLYFDGDLDYSVANTVGELTITATLIDSSGVAMPDLGSSSLSFNAIFDSEVDLDSFTAGLFNGVSSDDLIISDSTGTLLTGDFSQLYMIGGDSDNYGSLRGVLTATGGSLSNFFSSSDLIALEFNLGAVFGSDMFNNSFTGRVNGTLTGSGQSVPEPSILALLGIGLLMVGVARKVSKG